MPVIGLIPGKTLVMGSNAAETVRLVPRVALGMLTFLGHRTSPIQGMMQLMLFAVFGVLIMGTWWRNRTVPTRQSYNL